MEKGKKVEVSGSAFYSAVVYFIIMTFEMCLNQHNIGSQVR